MEHSRMSLPPLPKAGAVATFYSYDSGATRSMALANMAVMLAGRNDATTPVLMIDWDTESPTLHHVFDQRDEHAGLLELFEACRDYLQVINCGPGAQARAASGQQADLHDTALALQVLEAVDWQRYVQRVDQSRSLYLMRAGCFDADYGRRANQMDWEGLFETCPALFRCFAQEAARYFSHVLVDARGGRSTTVSICTTLLPDKLVTLFTPNQRSLDGMEGVITRAINYRRSHEEEQRPLIAYPVACAMDSTDSDRRREWRRGDAHKGIHGYQGVLERLLRHCYGISSLSIDSYLDEVQLQQARGTACGVPLVTRDEHGGDRFSLTRSFEALLEWVADGRFPWQSHAEIKLLADIATLRGDDAAAMPLARALESLGQLHHAQGRHRQALDCFQECAALREQSFGASHASTVSARTSAADMLRHLGRLNEARTQYEALGGKELCAPIAVRAGLACTLALQNHLDQALELEQSIGASLEQWRGADDPATLDSLARQADILSQQGELSRARQADERVLAGRRRQFGVEHGSTLACMQHMAMVLCRLGDMAQARKLQELVVNARVRHAGIDHADTLHAHEALATILAEQGDLDGLRRLQESLAHARERQLGSEHPETLSSQLRLAATLGQQGEVDAARRLHDHVTRLHEHLRHGQGTDAMGGKMATLGVSMTPDHAAALRHLDDSVRQASDRLRHLAHGMAAPGMAGAAGSTLDPEHVESLNRRIDEVQQLIESGQLDQARDLADSLRKPLLRPGIGPRQRVRGMAVLKRMYKIQGDQQALNALHEAEARALDDPHSEVRAVNS
jgi:tetratricopeptide (TPR) repeat protein